LPFFIFLIVFILSLFSTAQVDIPEEPYLTIGGDDFTPFFRPLDLAMDDEGNVYILTKDENEIMKFDRHGDLLSRYGGKGQAPGEFGRPRGILFSGGMIWVIDMDGNNVTLFKNDTYLDRIKLGNTPFSIAQSGSQVCIAPVGLKDEFFLFNLDGTLHKTFRVSEGVVEPPYDEKQTLWLMFKIAALRNDEILLGFSWMTKLAKVNKDGDFIDYWDVGDYYFNHVAQTQAGAVPIYFSAVAFAEGPLGNLWVASCYEKKRECGILYQFDMTTKKPVGRKDFNGHIRVIHFFQNKTILAITHGDDRTELFKMKTPTIP